MALGKSWSSDFREIVYDSKQNRYFAFKGDQYLSFRWNTTKPEDGPKKIDWPALEGAWAEFDQLVYDSKRDVYYAFGFRSAKHQAPNVSAQR